MPTAYLVRHGEYDNPRGILPGRLPVELSAAGRRQAEAVREALHGKPIAAIFSSAVVRCKQTAEIIAGDRPITYDKRLLETLSAYQGYWGENVHAGGYHFLSHTAELGGESIADVYARVADFWDEVKAGAEGNIVIVSHGDPLASLLGYIEGRPPYDDTATEAQIPGYLARGAYIAVPF